MKIFISIILFFSFLFAKLQLQGGLKFSRFSITDWYSSDTGLFNYTVFYEPYLGISGEVLLSFKNLSFRSEIFELRFYTKFSKRRSFHFFSNLDCYFLYTIAITKILSFFPYLGFNYEQYFNKPKKDIRSCGPIYEARFGLGMNYSLKRRIKIFLESQIITKYQIYERKIGNPYEIYKTTKLLLGVKRINLGFRYLL